MTEDTILFVIGDHGMTSDGNHGGATYNETITTTFAYSKRKFNQVVRKYKISDFDENFDNVIDQIDLLPTLAMILGIPIPFNNLGIFLPDLKI